MFINEEGIAINDGAMVQNGQLYGSLSNHITMGDFGPNFAGLRQPYYNARGQRAVTINTGRMVPNKDGSGYMPERREVLVNSLMQQGIYTPVMNATTLTKEAWLKMDAAILRAARLRLGAWIDLAAANSYGGFDGMSTETLEHQTQSDPGEAIVDMDGLTEGRTDTPLFRLQATPLPITHSDFWFPLRKLNQSRRSGLPLETTQAEAAGRRVAEMIEKTLIGTVTGYRGDAGPYASGYGYGTGGATGDAGTRYNQVYGYLNYPDRLTKTNLTAPTASGWSPDTTAQEVLAMRQQLTDGRFYGPYMLYHSTDWDQYFDGPYYKTSTSGAVAPNTTLREWIGKYENIKGVRRLDFLPASTNPFTLVMVQMTPDVCQAVNGMDITTVQWESVGGMRLNFKVMAIQVARLRSDFYGRCGILQATTS